MRIISKFQDYYDHAIQHDQIDPNIKYIRETKEQVYDYKDFDWLPKQGSLFRNDSKMSSYSFDILYKDKYRNPRTTEIGLSMAVLAVGRKLYPVWMRHQRNPELNFNYTNGFGYYNDPFAAPTPEDYMRLICSVYERNGYLDVSFKSQETYRYAADKEEKKRAVAHENRIQVIANTDATELCLHFQTPVVLIVGPGYTQHPKLQSETHVILNPPLRALNMMLTLDVYQAWQDISMWIGGVMPGACSPMIELSNESRIDKAGFDRRTSFRRQSSK